MDLQHLRTFRAVAHYGSVRKTAHVLRYSPASISQQITQLQKDINLALFEKSGRGLKLTTSGELLVTRLDDFFRECSSLETYIAGLREEKESAFSCYYITSFGAAVIPHTLQQITKDFPRTRFDLHLSDQPHIVTSPQPDLQLIVEEEGFKTPPHFIRHRILTEPYCVAIPQDHRLAQNGDPLDLADLKDELWIDTEPAKGWCWQTLVNSCQRAGFFPNFHVQAYDYPMALQLVSSGLGICVLPRIGGQRPGEKVVIRNLNDSGPRRTISALIPQGAKEEPIANRMIELLRVKASPKRF
ncbi:LysR family transcriptional regulator [Rothia terrae]|uniref:LysR family transcriptional regulator n=1 Tax=Rothia terrae TaxID=396015 RepID=A0A7S7B033_9MICC|nr:LysR family transcriptional regulator [Rothia terrae]QOW64719.1 LysR family transcriptional regulator [Rothia terrae]